jgi:hypothetical protein
VASQHLRFRPFGVAEIAVRGWPALPDAQAQGEWNREYSDHALIDV